MKKDSFVLYNSYKKHLSMLTNEQKGILLDAIFDYSESKIIPKLEQVLMMAFNFIKEDLDINTAKYEQTCERNKANGVKGGRPKAKSKKKRQRKNPVGSSETHSNRTDAKKADSDSDSDSDNDSDNDIKVLNSKEEFQVFVDKINTVGDRGFTARDDLLANFEYYRKRYKLEDMVNAIDNYKGIWFEKDFSPELLLRTRNKNGNCDYIEALINNIPKHKHKKKPQVDYAMQQTAKWDKYQKDKEALTKKRDIS